MGALIIVAFEFAMVGLLVLAQIGWDYVKD